MNIWFDLQAAPDPFFFRPIIKEMRRFGHNIIITSRDFGETVAVCKHCGYDFKVVGNHGGMSSFRRTLSTASRIFSLARLMLLKKIDIAVSFNSYTQAITCKLCHIRFVTFMDYEYHPLNQLAFRLAETVVVPLDYNRSVLEKQVKDLSKVRSFHGLKEYVSILGFAPDDRFPGVLMDLGISPTDIVVTMRPPAEFCSYHPFHNELFDELVLYLAAMPRVKIVYLPRNEAQAEKARALALPNLVIPPYFLDGLQLAYFSDLVVSGGGSMNREAAVMGTPAYSAFMGKMAGVDLKLIQSGRMVQVQDVADFGKVLPVKKKRQQMVEKRKELLGEFIAIIGSE